MKNFFTKEDVTEKRKLYVENDLLWSIPELKDRTTEDKFKAIRAKGYSIIKAMTYGLDPMRTMISFRIQQLRQFRLQAGFEKTGIVEGATSKK